MAKEKQKLLKELLDHQVNQKAIAREKERLYKDEKELATSKQMLKQLNPLIAANTAVSLSPHPPRHEKILDQVDLDKKNFAGAKGHPIEMGADHAILEDEVNRLYQIANRNQGKQF